ncbi:MFS transporter [Capillimicrobium parvum]|uniref:Multidrug resistance protein 3 n=1 Tax=Capillimicrobium parvum TaxID=2884022 RepID=A0A9E6Y1S5_9ACTN|nr:MFS transporter [Capillimicrobium parvum]UGS38078.1 Multidrug resistance protein 3 [Capillimicrobium parvum]
MPSPDAPARQHHNLTFAVLAVAGMSYSLMQSLVAPALPEIQRDLHTSATAVTWLLTGYLLSASVITPIAGRLGDMFGKERVLVITLAVLTGGTVVAALATSIEVMILGRLLQGAGGAMFPLAFGIIRDEFPREKVAGGIAMMSVFLGLGGGLGIVLAGPIVDNLGYHWLFWLPLAPVAFATIATVLWIPESPLKVPGKVNWAGAALLSSWLVVGLVAISQGSSWGWTSPRMLGSFALTIVLIALWIANERRAAEPLVDMRMMRRRGVWTVNLAAILVGAGMYSSFILIPQFVEMPTGSGYGFGSSVTGAGLFMLPSTTAMLLSGPIAGRMSRRYGSRPPMLLGAAVLTLSFLMLAFVHTDPVDVYVAAALVGFGVGFCFASLANLIVEVVPPEQTGVATGMNTVMRTIGGAIGSTVTAAVIASTVVGGSEPTESGFTMAFMIAAGAAGLALLTTFLVPRPRRGYGRVLAPERAAA